MAFEQWLAEIIRSRSINLSDLARQAGVSYRAIYGSLFQKDSKRQLRSLELIRLCRYLGVNPMDFSGWEIT